MFDLSIWPYCDDAVECARDALSFIAHHDELSSILSDSLEKYRWEEDIDWKEVLDDLDREAGRLGISPYTADWVHFVNLLDEALKRYRRRNLSFSLFVDSFDDLRVKCEECFSLYGIYGSFVARWYSRFFDLTCFSFGRLEAEEAKFKDSSPLSEGETVINIHIPSKGKLDEEECEKSYRMASDFFNRRDFVTDSWLLNPLNSQLGPESGIVKFASRYRLLHMTKDEKNSDAWRIFNRPDVHDPQSLPQDTRLQRIYREHMLNRGTIDRGYGYFHFE